MGDPVAQVRAPEIFNYLFDKHGVDAALVPAHVASGDLEPFVRTALAMGNCGGLWVYDTIAAAVDADTSDLRRLIGA